MTIERTQVLWLGSAPAGGIADECSRRGLTLATPTAPLSDLDFAVSRAVVFSFDPTRKGESIGLVRQYAERAAEHGLLVVVHANNEDEVRLVQGHLLAVPETHSRLVDLPRPLKKFSLGRPAHELAESAARHPAGPPFSGGLMIKGATPTRAQDVLLLRRAFGDCSAITIQPLTPGFSGARVFAVYAQFPPGEVASYPLPYFAKLDESERILTEYENYDRFVTRYIPFNLRPNCEPKRCLLGLKTGILVGDFVDQSVSLADMVEQSEARSVIHSLFDDALRGWRFQAFTQEQREPIADIRPRIFEPSGIRDAYVSYAGYFSPVLSANDLTALIDNCAKSYRRGPIHGDLNTQNVRVRNGDAILIDFYKSTYGPLIADLASLEIAICFTTECDASWSPDKDGVYHASLRFADWRRHIDALFSFEPGRFGLIPPIEEQAMTGKWMWAACRQLRLMAYYCEPNEEAYGYVLAAYMLRMAMYPKDDAHINMDSPDAIVRAYAYRTADRLLRAMNATRTPS